jgi:hypothetical protein
MMHGTIHGMEYSSGNLWPPTRLAIAALASNKQRPPQHVVVNPGLPAKKQRRDSSPESNV